MSNIYNLKKFRRNNFTVFINEHLEEKIGFKKKTISFNFMKGYSS